MADCQASIHSNLTQWKRAGLITLKSLDRNQELLYDSNIDSFLSLAWIRYMSASSGGSMHCHCAYVKAHTDTPGVDRKCAMIFRVIDD